MVDNVGKLRFYQIPWLLADLRHIVAFNKYFEQSFFCVPQVQENIAKNFVNNISN